MSEKETFSVSMPKQPNKTHSKNTSEDSEVSLAKEPTHNLNDILDPMEEFDLIKKEISD